MQDVDLTLPVDSPSLPVDKGIVKSPKAFSDGLTLDLTDDEITQALQITLRVKTKWQDIFRSRLRHSNFTVEQAMRLCDQFEDELVTRLAESLDIIATVDASPVFEGEPPIVDFIGALDSHYSAKYGADHEKKTYEVRKAERLGQAFLGVDKLQ